MTYRIPWIFALMLVPALLLLAPSGLAAESNMSFNFKANGKYLSCATADIEKALSGAHPKTSLREATPRAIRRSGSRWKNLKITEHIE